MELLCPDEKIATDLECDVLTLNEDFDTENLSSDHFLGSSLMLDSSDLVFDETESEQTNNSEDDYSTSSEIKSLEEDKPQAVWVKWRGKWQSGIRCARCDWPLSTLKAKPTHERKQYLVIFFPRTRNYSWADVLLIRPISEFPRPIPYKTHAVGVKMVRDLSLARRFITQRLSVSILNILNRLNREAFSENARDVMVLKDFAMEISHCMEYSDLGKMLLKLENMILHCYMDPDWIHQSLESWKKRCDEANSAEGVEVLKEEFSENISWDKVNSLPTSPSDWKSWKNEAMKLFSFSVPNPLHIDMGSAQPTAGPSKRPKLEIRRAETHSSLPSLPPVPEQTDSGSLTHYDVVVSILSQESSKTKEETKWKDIVVEETGFSTPGTTSVVATAQKKSFGIGNHNPQCAAFVESKSRQCARYASEGDIYCCAHLPTRFLGYSNTSTNAERTALRSVDSPMCGGTTVLGTKCKHRALVGSSFCKKHRKNDEDLMYQEVSVPIQVEVLDDTNQMLMKMPESAHPEASNGENEVARCVGLGIDEGETCLENLKRHSLYCEKHIPDWLKPARNGKTRIVSKKIFVELLKSCFSREQKLQLHKACELFYKLFKRILSLRNTVPAETHFQWAVSEASKDIRVGEFLMKLVCHEKERLTSLWDIEDCLNLSAGEEFVSIPVEVLNDGNNSGDEENKIKCKICFGNFINDEELGKHWMENHRKEAQWHFRGFVCAICLDSFTNRKLLEAHVKERHHVEFVEQCMLLQCIPCGSHFGNLDNLWSHVLSTHSSSLRFSESQNQDKNVGDSNSVPDNRRFICKFCGLKFDLLPDLGRHHQAAHMGIQTKKKGIQFYAQRFKKSLNSASYKIRNRSMQNIKKRIQSSNNVKVKSSSMPEAAIAIANLDTLANSECSYVAKMLIPEIEKTKLRPSNSEILSIATSACCKVNLQTSLEDKYGVLPERIYLKAAKLCSERNISIQWHLDGFICPRGCVPSLTSPILTPVDPISSNSKKPRYSVKTSLMLSEWTIDECHCVIDSRHFSMDLSENNIVLCDDISFGQESVPIACVVDEVLLNAEATEGEYSFPWESFTYVTKALPDKSVVPELESLQMSCVCSQSKCLSATCDHVYLFDNDYEDAKDIHGKSMNGRFPYDERGRIILQEGYLVYECNQRCHCSKSCQNRVLQNGVKVKMEIFKTEKKGWAVRTRQAIPRGTFVCEYIGEVIDENEANERRNRYGEEGCRYLFEFDDRVNVMSRLIEEQVHYVIDATNYGNVSRYINHGCSPNLVSHQVLVESMDSQLAHIGLYANQDIAAGEELTYDYRYKLLSGEGCPCLCGFSDCRRRLY